MGITNRITTGIFDGESIKLSTFKFTRYSHFFIHGNGAGRIVTTEIIGINCNRTIARIELKPVFPNAINIACQGGLLSLRSGAPTGQGNDSDKSENCSGCLHIQCPIS